jgi:hypothetical protein
LPDQLWSLILGYSLVCNVLDVAQRSTVGFFTDVKPLLVPISKRSVPGAVEIFLLHPMPKGQIHYAGDFGATLGPLLPQAEQISKEVKMGLDSPIHLTKVDENKNKED